MSISVIIYWSTNPSVKKGTEVLQVFLESWFVKSKLTIHFFQHFLNYMQQTQLFHIRKLIRKEQSQCWEHYFPNSCKPRWMPEDRKRIIGKLNYFVKLLRVSWVFYSLFFTFTLSHSVVWLSWEPLLTVLICQLLQKCQQTTESQ